MREGQRLGPKVRVGVVAGEHRALGTGVDLRQVQAALPGLKQHPKREFAGGAARTDGLGGTFAAGHKTSD